MNDLKNNKVKDSKNEITPERTSPKVLEAVSFDTFTEKSEEFRNTEQILEALGIPDLQRKLAVVIDFPEDEAASSTRRTLRGISKGAEIGTFLADHFKDFPPEKRPTVTELIYEIGGKTMVPFLAELLDDHDADVALAAAKGVTTLLKEG